MGFPQPATNEPAGFNDRRKVVWLVFAGAPAELQSRFAALGSAVREIARLLLSAGYDVHVNGDPPPLEPTTAGPPPEIPARSRLRSLLPNRITDILRDLRLFLRLALLRRRLLRKPRPDVLLEIYRYGSCLGASLARHWDLPLVVLFDAPAADEHTGLYDRPPAFPGVINRRQGDTLRQASKVIAYSPSVISWLETKYDLEGSRFLIHQNIDYSRLCVIGGKETATDEIQISFIGSFLPWHRLDLLIRAFDRIRAEGIRACLWLIGQGIEFRRIHRLASAALFSGDIRMPGYVDGDALTAIKRRCHIGVVPGSNWYGAPVKIFEYGCAGMAVVAPSTPTISDLERNGFPLMLFEEGNLDDLVRALRTLALEPPLIHERGEALRARICRQYTFEKDVAFYAELLDSALRRRRA